MSLGEAIILSGPDGTGVALLAAHSFFWREMPCVLVPALSTVHQKPGSNSNYILQINERVSIIHQYVLC
jgi:hypothetical protein